MSARGTGIGTRAAALALLLLATAGAALAGCGHYGPPVRAEEYRLKQEAERAAEQQQRRAKGEKGAAEAPAQAPVQDDETGGAPAPEPGVGPLEGLEAP